MKLTFQISDTRPFINWIYFFHAWGMGGKQGVEREQLKADAEAMLDHWEGRFHTYAVFELFDANSDGDDLLLGNVRIPMLRQQKVSRQRRPSLCLADFVRPLSSGVKDKVGAFATTVDADMEHGYRDDVYRHMLVQVLAERLAESTAERMHTDVRKHYWGYAAGENLPITDILNERYQGIRPAVGYPSMPDMSVNFILSDLLDMPQIGIHLTESGMMTPHASVSGLMFSHPKATYFDIGKIGEDQLRDYARRRGLPVELMRRFLASSLIRK